MRLILTSLILSVLYTGTALAEPFAYIANSGSRNVSVIDVSTNTVVATVDVGIVPAGVAVTPNGDFVYVANGTSRTVSVIRTSDNTVVATVDVGFGPQGVAVTPDGDFVYVANAGSNNVSVIETSDNKVFATVEVGSLPVSLGLFITPTQGPGGGSSSGCSIAAVAVDGKGVAFTSVAILLISAFVIGVRRFKRKRNKK